MSAYYPQDASFLSKRAIVFVAILVIHAVVIYAFASGLAKSGQRYLQTILQTNIIQTEKPKDLPPPPITNVTTKPTPPPPPPPRAPPAPTKLEVTYKPDISNYYPEQARRDGQEGRAQVKICINTSGKVESAEIASSSGFPILDEAAIKVGRAFRFKPPTQEGKPVATCPVLPVKFELHATS